jgi:transposase
MSGHSSEERFVIVADARRRRSRAEKEAIVAELNVSGETVSAVARKHNIAASLLFRWRREFGAKESAAPREEPGRSFVPVALPVLALPSQTARPSGMDAHTAIEIVLAGGRRVIVGQDVDIAALKRVIEALEPR